jgi:ComF family protein
MPLSPVPSTTAHVCGRCLSDPPHFDDATAAFVYAFPLNKLVQSFKFSANLALADFLAARLADRVRAQFGDVGLARGALVMALPLAPQRLASRGFNQSAVLADALARSLTLSVAHHQVLRIRDTPPQAGLSREDRIKNVRGAFSCKGGVVDRHVILVDDVMTTGATLSEAARAIRKAGAARVSAWVVARAIPDTAARQAEMQ